jgi:histidine-containing phosphotransfer peotein
MADLAQTMDQLQALLSQCLQQGVLDDQFMQLMQLQDDANPDFVSEMTELYFEDSDAKINKLTEMVSAPTVDFAQVDALVHQFKGSSASFGAKKMAATCIQLRDACHSHRGDVCSQLAEQLAGAFAELREALQRFLQLEARRKQLCQGG